MKQLDYNRLLETEWADQFYDDQLEVIEAGIADGVDVGPYANPEYTPAMMWAIHDALTGAGADMQEVTKYLGMDYSMEQLEAILLALDEGLDISKCDDPRFTANQMDVILSAVAKEMDVSQIINPEITPARMKAILNNRPYDHLPENIQAPEEKLEEYRRLMDTDWVKQFDEWQLKQIQKGLALGVDISVYAKPDFDQDQMGQILTGLANGLYVKSYARPEFAWSQMWEIRVGLENGIDTSIYANPEFNTAQMAEIRRGLADELDVDIYAKPEFDHQQMGKSEQV